LPPNTRINQMRRRSPIDWSRSARRLCARRWARRSGAGVQRGAGEDAKAKVGDACRQGDPGLSALEGRRFEWSPGGSKDTRAPATGAVRIPVTTVRQVHKMANRSTADSIDEYIAEFPPETQKVLEELRALIQASAPDATETISYAIPTFDLDGRHLVHFAGYAKHIGFYPVPSAVEAFKEELQPYKSGKGSAQFPLGQPLPTDLIRRIVEFRVEENTGKAFK
jgi:uncharacterized protein YdhG (YjbR/CyaY superfamily)